MNWAHIRRAALGSLLCLTIASGTGCESAGQGAASGAAVGALSGLAIGSMSGNAGRGAAIGAIAGGAGGAVVGDQNRRNRENADRAARQNQTNRAASPTPTPPPPSPAVVEADRDRASLAGFRGDWSVSGWLEREDGTRSTISGRANGVVEHNFFLVLDLNIRDDQFPDAARRGNAIFASEPGNGITMTVRFDNLPSTIRYSGDTLQDGTVISVREEPSMYSRGRRITIRFVGNDQWIADVSERRDGSMRVVESLAFMRDR